jgi:hypothetical protein
MAFMHKVNNKQQWILIAVATILLGTTLINREKKEDAMPSAEIRELDAMLLSDLRSRPVELDHAIVSTMDCAGLKENDLKELFAIGNVNYEKCDPGNCHYNSYRIESSSKGREIAFTLTSSDTGTAISDLAVEGCN